MNKFILTCYRSLHIALISSLILIMLPVAFIKNANAQQQYAEQAEFSEVELAQILAPIALYPDSLLTHILIASTYPLEVVQADRWRTENRHLNTSQLMQKAEDRDWDPSVITLIAFPNILGKLSDDLNWTQTLGHAFLQDEAAVLASIQSLRRQADRAKSLQEMENMSVTRVDNLIIIEPARNGIVYVPYYDTRVVYGRWYSPAYPPVYWAPSPYYVRRPHSNFYWHSGIHISFNYYFTTFNWPKRHLIVVNHRHSHDYRPRKRIISSEGARHWSHKPQSIRVIEGKQHLKQRDDRRLPSSTPSIKRPYDERRQLPDNKANINREPDRDRLKRILKEQDKPNKGVPLPHNKNEQKTRDRTERVQQDRLLLKDIQPTQSKSEQKTRDRTERVQQDKLLLKDIQPTQSKREQKTRDRTERVQQDRLLLKDTQPTQSKREQKTRDRTERVQQDNLLLKDIQPTLSKSEQETNNRPERVQQEKNSQIQQRRDKDTQPSSKCSSQSGDSSSVECINL